MNIDFTLKHFVLISSLSVLVSGCDVNNFVGQSTNGNTTKSTIKKAGIAESQDLFSLDYDILHINKPISACNTNQFCINLGKVPYATFAAGIDGNNKWLIKNYLTSFEIKFNAAMPKDFHLANISSNFQWQNGHPEIMGEITQVDTSDCDTLANNGITQGSRCRVKFTYNGNTMDSTKGDTFHFIFKWGQDQNSSYDFAFTTTNQKDNNSLAILNLKDDTDFPVINIFPQETNSGNGIDYNIGYSYLALTNNGNQPIKGNGSDYPVQVTTGDSYSNTFNLYNLNGLGTSCGNNDILPNALCKFEFKLNPNDPGYNQITPWFGRVLFQYQDPSLVEYVSPLSVSIGNIQNKNYLIDNNSPNPSITVTRIDPQGSLLGYYIPLSNVKFFLRYNPNQYIGNSVNSDSGKIQYSVGDIADNQLTKIGELVNSIQLTPENVDCFNEDFDPAGDDVFADDNTDHTEHNCKVKLGFLQAIPNDKPLTYQLYASYDTPIGGRKIEQFIGNLTLAGHDYSMPGGQYQSLFHDIQYKNGVLTGVMNNASPLMSSLDYFDSCNPGSTVSSLSFYQHAMKWNSLEFLRCDQWASKFPKGSYQKSCINLKIDNSTLSASCITQNADRDNVLQNSTLDTSKCPANGDITIDSLGNLQCSQ